MGVRCVRIGDDCGCKMGALLIVLIHGTCKGDSMELYNNWVVHLVDGSQYDRGVLSAVDSWGVIYVVYYCIPGSFPFNRPAFGASY